MMPIFSSSLPAVYRAESRLNLEGFFLVLIQEVYDHFKECRGRDGWEWRGCAGHEDQTPRTDIVCWTYLQSR